MNACNPIVRTLGNCRLEVILGDITDQDTEAIVNAANNHFWMGGGVAGAIKRRGGAEIEQEAMKLGPVEPGAAVTTSAGRLKAKFCIHAAVMEQDLVTNAELITRATSNALQETARLKIRSVAFPALGTGVGGFAVPACARLMLAAALRHCQKHQYPELIRFVLFEPAAFQAFAQILSSLPETP
ncbi:MAG: macro domain-containing protein [candidate division WOR-3 bacterium]